MAAPVDPTIYPQLLSRNMKDHGIPEFDKAVNDYATLINSNPAVKTNATQKKEAMDKLNQSRGRIIGNINQLVDIARMLRKITDKQKNEIEKLRNECGTGKNTLQKTQQDADLLVGYMTEIIKSLMTNINGVNEDLEYANTEAEKFIQENRVPPVPLSPPTTGGKKNISGVSGGKKPAKKKVAAKKKTTTAKKPAKKKKPMKKKSVRKN